jgi:hypothetical protein
MLAIISKKIIILIRIPLKPLICQFQPINSDFIKKTFDTIISICGKITNKDIKPTNNKNNFGFKI